MKMPTRELWLGKHQLRHLAMRLRILPEAEGDWESRAACRGMDPDRFIPAYSSNGNGSRRSKNAGDAQIDYPRLKPICYGCPVRMQCLQEAVRKKTPGCWGGTSYAERRRIKRYLPWVLLRVELVQPEDRDPEDWQVHLAEVDPTDPDLWIRTFAVVDVDERGEVDFETQVPIPPISRWEARDRAGVWLAERYGYGNVRTVSSTACLLDVKAETQLEVTT